MLKCADNFLLLLIQLDKMIKRFFLIPLFCFMLFPALAQTDCNNYLDRASLMYREGRFTEAITVLKACAPADANEVNKWKVSRLLCQCYLGLNDIVAAKAPAKPPCLS